MKSNQPTYCMECGKPIPPGMNYLEIFDRATGQKLGDRCYTNCPGKPTGPGGAVTAYVNRLRERIISSDDELILLADFIVNAIRMREHQKAFFKGQKAHITDAIHFEKLVDIYIKHLNDDSGTADQQQPRLFGDDQ